MRMRLLRRSELLVPLALLIPSLAGRPREAAVIAAASALGQLCTLHGAESFRAAAAQEISPARVRGAWTAALLTTLLFAAIALIAGPSVWTWLFAAPPPRETWLALWLTGASLAIARLGDEHLRAAGQGETAALSAFVRAALLTGSAFCSGGWIPGAAVLSALVALTLACAVAGRPFAMPNCALFRQTPVALWRALLSALPALLLLAGFWRRGAAWAAAGYLLGTALQTCAATPFRRVGRECAALHLLLGIPAAALCIAAPFAPSARSMAALVTFFAVTGWAIYAAFSARVLLAGLALTISSLTVWLSPPHSTIIAVVCAGLALLALAPDIHTMQLEQSAARKRARRR